MVHELESNAESPAVSSSPLPKMTYEEFLAWDDGRHAEWVDGEVILISPASDQHQDLVGFLYTLLRHFAEMHDLGRVLIAPFQMKDDIYCSEVLGGSWFKVAWFWQQPLPPLMSILKDWGLA